MVEIIPAVMPYSFDDFSEKCQKAATVSHVAQVDVMDGMFVPSKSWPYTEEHQESFHHIIAGEHSLPCGDDMSYVADLMVSTPIETAHDWVNAGARRIIFHFESFTNPAELATFLPNFKQETAVEVGLSIDTTTDPAQIFDLLPFLNVVQCMGIEKVGYQGQDFDERVIENIRAIRAHDSELPIVVDGAVNETTIPRLVEAGATRLVVGSALFEAENFSDAYTHLNNIANR